MAFQMRTCPGCGVEMPLSEWSYDRKFNASAECWSLFEEVLAAEFQNAVLFGQVHQLTVDTYAVQHAGGRDGGKEANGGPDSETPAHFSVSSSAGSMSPLKR